MSRRDELTPEAARELAVVDRALAGAPVPPDLTRLEDLVLSLRTERPVPRREFAKELDERVERGFGSPEDESAADDRAADSRLRVLVGGLRARRRAVPLALGSAASVFIVAVALISGGGDAGKREQSPEGQPTVVEPSVPEQMNREAGREGGGGSAAAPSTDSSADRRSPALGVAPIPPPASARGEAPRARERKIERAASLTLAAAPGEVEDVADEVVRVTDRYRGFVLSSNVSSGSEGARRGATLDLRLPAGSLRPALADLSELGHVRSRTQSTQDVTAVFVSARSRLRDALAERRGLLRQLEQADTVNETASVRARLRSANRRIARARTQLRRVSDRVDYASLAVEIEPDGQSADDDSGWTPGDALDDALAILGAVLGAALVVLAVALPLALVALVAWLAFGRLARGRRERALDRAASD